MSDRPTLYLSNWSSHKTPGHHGPGRKWTIMAAPRRWEHGDGQVDALVPDINDLRNVKAGVISADDYFGSYESGLASMPDLLRPDHMTAGGPLRRSGPGRIDIDLNYVRDGDTLCCSCARGARCHRRVAAKYLHLAGWRVVLDGEEWTP